MRSKIVSIMGAGSHIAKGLILNLLSHGDFILKLFTRSPDSINSFLAASNMKTKGSCEIFGGYREFKKTASDVIINCIGTGTLKQKGAYTDYFIIGEEYDNMVISCLRDNLPDALYISFSSGALYGRNHMGPVNENTINQIRVNHVTSEDYYAISRLNSEAKHRAFNTLKIVDLRIFSYFSRFINLTDGYFITDVMDCILKNKTLVIDDIEIVRDYVHPEDLFKLIKLLMSYGKTNSAIDVYSAKPVSKREILNYFSANYGLKYTVNPVIVNISPTGMKTIYYSENPKAAEFGYVPTYSSLEGIAAEAKYLIDIDNVSS
jgi:nucleoside-diphosphate-sugar epimerase